MPSLQHAQRGCAGRTIHTSMLLSIPFSGICLITPFNVDTPGTATPFPQGLPLQGREMGSSLLFLLVFSFCFYFLLFPLRISFIPTELQDMQLFLVEIFSLVLVFFVVARAVAGFMSVMIFTALCFDESVSTGLDQ